MDMDYIVKVKKDANMELTSGSKERTRLRIIFAVEMLIASLVVFIFFLYERRTGFWLIDIFPGCFLLISSILLFIDFSWKMIIDNSGIYVKKYNKTHRINFEDLTDIRIESHIHRTKYSRYLWYFLVIEFFDNDKIKKISLSYKRIPYEYKETTYNSFHGVSDEDVDKLMNLFIKKSQISENNKDIEQYKDVRTQNTNEMIEEKIEQGRKTIETKNKILTNVALVAVFVVLAINCAVMVLLLK